ncbi:FecR family protein [Asticcacaulis tiandongensis]|uniref:FecR family protein n=1 Tax=Asticcacaulis tiandongensis TaxID=2565365 RepID=UPI00112EE90E|nr:FecR domain-containing protein [Asticcacaulis tiandongensis]
MPSNLPPLALPPDILTAAADWLQKRQTDALFDEVAFTQWLAEDPRHEDAWLRVQSMWASFDDYQTAPELLALRTRVLQRAYQRKQRRWSKGELGRRSLLFGGGAAAAAVIGAGLFLYGSHHQTFSTGIGEMRTLVLSDRSLITLDANSRLIVSYSHDLRRLELIQGRAHFDVAHDPSRPFQVEARHQTVTALGTDFTVELRPRALTVALFKGKVSVGEASGKLHQLTPLQELRLHSDLPEGFAIRPLNATQDLAWREGRLIFNNERLADAAERMSNYTQTRISVDRDVADMRISGMFMVGQTNAFIDALQAYYPLQADISPNRVTIRSSL